MIVLPKQSPFFSSIFSVRATMYALLLLSKKRYIFLCDETSTAYAIAISVQITVIVNIPSQNSTIKLSQIIDETVRSGIQLSPNLVVSKFITRGRRFKILDTKQADSRQSQP
ncbi:hypothetical protein P3L10_027195 [Capsicum annuum]